MRQIKLVGIILLGMAMNSPFVKAQNSCVQNLRDARAFYDEGRLDDLPDLLLRCINNGFAKEEKIEALRLVTLSHLFNENQEEAESAYLSLLRIDPEYTVDFDSDPAELILLSEKFDTEPKYYFGFKAGSSFSIIQITENNTIYNLAQPGSYDAPIGFSGGAFFQYPIMKDLSAQVEVHYNYRNTNLNRLVTRAEGNNSSLQTISETQQWLEMPLLANYRIPYVKKFLLEATAGPSFHYLLDSRLTITGVGEELNNKDMNRFRNQWNTSAILGLRANFKKLGKNFFTVEALFQYRFLEEVNMEVNRSQLNFDLAKSAYTENQYKGHALLLRLGFRFPHFNPELIK